MTKTLSHAVHAAVCHRLGPGTSAVSLSGEMDEAAELTPLQVVLVTLDIEESEHTYVPIEALAAVRNVGQLFDVFTSERSRRGDSHTS